MPSYAGLVSIDQPCAVRLTWCFMGAGECRECPNPSSHEVKVSSFHPMSVLLWMSATAPTPQFAPYFKVHSPESAARNAVPVIVYPSSNNGVESNDQIGLRHRFIVLDQPSDLRQERLRVLSRRRHQQFASELAEVVAKEIE